MNRNKSILSPFSRLIFIAAYAAKVLHYRIFPAEVETRNMKNIAVHTCPLHMLLIHSQINLFEEHTRAGPVCLHAVDFVQWRNCTEMSLTDEEANKLLTEKLGIRNWKEKLEKSKFDFLFELDKQVKLCLYYEVRYSFIKYAKSYSTCTYI